MSIPFNFQCAVLGLYMCIASHLAKTLGFTLALNRKGGKRRGREDREGTGGGREEGEKGNVEESYS